MSKNLRDQPADLWITDFINMAYKATQNMGAGILALNKINDSTSFMSGSSIEAEIETAKQEDDEETTVLLTGLLERIDSYDPKTHVLIMVITEEKNTITELPLSDIQ